MSDTLRVAVVMGLVMLLAGMATADALPNRTPKEVVNQSDMILVLEFVKPDAEASELKAKVTRVVKGKFTPKEITLDLEVSELSKVADAKLKDFIGKGQKQGLLFVGKFKDFEYMNPEETLGFLHLAGEFTDMNQNEWFSLGAVPDRPAEWDLLKIDSQLLSCFSGGTDMLLRCVDYVLTDKNAEVPAYCDATWAPEIALGKVSGKVYAAKAIDLTGNNANGRADLFIAADSGDKLFRYADGKMADITVACKLTSKSQAFAWGDFDGNAKLDLASYDGKGLTVHSQQADGTFVVKTCDTGDALSGLIELSTMDVGSKGRPALLATGRGYPVLLTIGEDTKVTAKPLGKGEFPEKDVGTVGHSLAADFDGDGVADIVQLGSKGGLFYKGKSPGEFAAPALTLASCGEGRSAACLGDFDADGLPDILTVAGDQNRLWQNLGGGKFINMLVASGDIFYRPRAGGTAVNSGDYNNDGRADVLIVYGVEQRPHLYFNRGFRSFEHAYSVDLDELPRLDQARQGQQAGCLADFTGDGALDMLLVLKKDGEVWLFPRQVDDKTPSSAVIAALPLGGTTAGPLNVCAWSGTRPLGAQAVRAGEPGAFYGTKQPGPVMLKWKTPDGKEHEKAVAVEKGPVRVMLDDGK